MPLAPRRLTARLAALVLTALVSGSTQALEAADAMLGGTLSRVAERHGVDVKGLEKTAGVPAPAAEGDSRERFEALLIDVDHIMIERAGQPVERVIIVARWSDDETEPEVAEAPGERAPLTLANAPVDGGRVSSGYGMRRHPNLGYSKMHRGAYGNYVRIRHDARHETAYAHLGGFASDIRRGARVRRGQVIGHVGSSGRATGAHLHYEVLVDGRQVDPRAAAPPLGDGREG